MRIISKFKDQYDGVMGFGHDDSLIFVREQTEYERSSSFINPRLPPELAFMEALSSNVPRALNIDTSSADRKFKRVSVWPRQVLLAGKIYPGVHVEREITNPCEIAGRVERYQVTQVYNIDELQAILTEHDYELDSKARWTWTMWGKGSSMKYSDFFAQETPRSVTEACFAARCVLANLTYNKITINPQLKALGFYRCIDAWQVYQEISMFLGNIASPDDTPIKISDKDRIYQHGFDRYSFRKHPSK